MPAVRFTELELTYGCHAGLRLRFADRPEPTLICGPNGAGKSTLLEALVRTLFGFNRRYAEDRERVATRSPWSEASFTARVVLARGSERVEVARDFETDEVTLRPLDGEGEPWRGDGNPGSTNQEATTYRRRLRELFGFSERDGYEATACVHQGTILDTRLNDSLLQLAAGGHGNVEHALAELAERHRERTKAPIGPGVAARNDRELERMRAVRRELEMELREAERAVRRRTPIQTRIDELRERRSALRHEVRLLEAAQSPLTERRALRAEREGAAERRKAVTALRRKVEDALRRYAAARELGEELGEGPSYPDDFPERLSRLETLWRQRQEAEARRDEAEGELSRLRPVPPVAAIALAAGGVSLLTALAAGVGAAGSAAGAVAAVLALVGLCLVGFAAVRWDRIRSRRERLRTAAAEAADRAAEVERAVERTSREVPNGESLRPSNAAERRDRFDRERRARERLQEALDRLAAALDEAQEGLGRAEAGMAEGEEVEEAAGEVLEHLASREDELRTEEAKKGLELQASGENRLELPAGVPPEPAAVRAALAERRDALEGIADDLRREERQLLEEGSPGESAVALQDRLNETRGRVEELEREVAVLERAHALIRDAYGAFRERDEERLVAHISRRMERLSGGTLGPLEAEAGLSEATVRLDGRTAELGSPPLSYGEYHAALLGIRLGAIDFLSTAGIRPPLIVDEPFAHLDEERSRGLWEALRRAAADRQVIVATQDRLLLRHLHLKPDVRLGRGPGEGGAQPTQGTSENYALL